MIKKQISIFMAVMSGLSQPLSAQSLFHRIDTTYISRPTTKWTISARMNVSGTKIKTEGMDNGRHFLSEMKADRKATLSLGVSYLGVSLSASLNPAKLMGKYRDYELNFNSYGRRFGFDIVYQDAKNFSGWHDKGWNVSNCQTVYYQ